MLKNSVYAVLLLGATTALSASALAAPAAPQSRPGVFHIVPVQGWGERERWGERGGERWGERCHWLRERVREVEGRLYSAPPWERPRLEHRLFELREEFRGSCRRGY
jgi:hypothetical protein